MANPNGVVPAETWTIAGAGRPASSRLAQTASGRMVGDYVATVFAGQRVVSVHVQARPPQGDQLNEAVYAFSAAIP